MALQFYYHPLASFCHKVLIALNEKAIPFEPAIVDFGDPESTAAFKAIWPMGKMPVLVDRRAQLIVAETTIILEYLDRHFPAGPRLLPIDPDRALQARFWDRFYDHYVEVPMHKIVVDNLRPPGKGDRFGVEQARDQLREAYGVIDREMTGKTWAMGEEFRPGRLRRGAWPLLCQYGRADRSGIPKRGGLSAAAHDARLLCARAAQGGAVFRQLPDAGKAGHLGDQVT